MTPMPYYHVDVFSSRPFAGNGLIVFPAAAGLSTENMQVLTQEMRQYESIFLTKIDGDKVRARIFTCTEELAFAGHPVLGAAATLHDLMRADSQKVDVVFQLNEKTLTVTTEKKPHGYDGLMNQGTAVFGTPLDAAAAAEILRLIGATPEDLYPGLRPAVVSTGLPYLIVPLYNNKFRARIGAPGLEEKLHAIGAKFIGLLDIEEGITCSIRTGDNDGSVEDIATGSLAGPSGAFLVKNGLVPVNKILEIRQGKNLGRDSRLYVHVRNGPGGEQEVLVGGSVCKIARGEMVYLQDQ